MDYELWEDLQQRRMEEAELYRLQKRARRRPGRPNRAVWLVGASAAVAVAVVLGALLVTVTGTG